MSLFVSRTNRYYGKYLLLGMDFALIAASIVRHHINFPGGEDLLSVSKDGGYAEYFQYAKLATIVVLLYLVARVKRSALIGGWGIIFFILLADDALKIHERGGARLADWFSFSAMYNLRAVDYGELMVFALWGLIAIAILTVTSRIDRSPTAREVSKGLFLLLLGLACFGGLFDMLHIAAANTWELSATGNNLFDAVEDGGEMVVVSLVLGFVYRIYLNLKFKRSV